MRVLGRVSANRGRAAWGGGIIRRRCACMPCQPDTSPNSTHASPTPRETPAQNYAWPPPNTLPPHPSVLRACLPDKGFTAHVIGFTVAAVLAALTSKCEVHGHLDSSVPLVLPLIGEAAGCAPRAHAAGATWDGRVWCAWARRVRDAPAPCMHAAGPLREHAGACSTRGGMQHLRRRPPPPAQTPLPNKTQTHPPTRERPVWPGGRGQGGHKLLISVQGGKEVPRL